MIRLSPATTNQQLQTIEALANEIWNEHYTPIIGKAQVDYMLNKFQSVDSIFRQLESDYKYFIINYDNSAVGYLAFKLDNSDLFLSKIYILKKYRGLRIGKEAMEFVTQLAASLMCKTITLTVNKNNTNSIEAYKKIGFLKTEELVMDIGNGFVMDDYKMVKSLG